MGWPLGKAPNEDGTGTTPLDLQRVIGGQFMNSGLLPNGGGTTEPQSRMAYKVNPGVCFMWTSFSDKLAMYVPFEATTVETDAAPSTGSRTDTIYVDGDGGVRVAVGSRTPPTGVAIGRWTVPAGITATTSAMEQIGNHYQNYAIPAGASLGRLAQWTDPGGGKVGTSEITRHTEQFSLPSDRLIRVDLLTTIKSFTSSPGTAQFMVDFTHESGPGSTRRMLAAHTPEWNTTSALWTFVASAGEWTIRVKTKAYSGGTFIFGNASDLLTEMNLWDVGASR